MDFEEALGQKLTRKEAEAISIKCKGTLGKSAREKVFGLIDSDDDVVAFNALWTLSLLSLAEMRWLKPMYNRFVDLLLATDNIPRQRVLLSLLDRQTIKKSEVRTDYLDFCLSRILSNEPVAIRAYCLKQSFEMCRFYPELVSELESSIELMEQYPLPPALAAARRAVVEKIRLLREAPEEPQLPKAPKRSTRPKSYRMPVRTYQPTASPAPAKPKERKPPKKKKERDDEFLAAMRRWGIEEEARRARKAEAERKAREAEEARIAAEAEREKLEAEAQEADCNPVIITNHLPSVIVSLAMGRLGVGMLTVSSRSITCRANPFSRATIDFADIDRFRLVTAGKKPFIAIDCPQELIRQMLDEASWFRKHLLDMNLRQCGAAERIPVSHLSMKDTDILDLLNSRLAAYRRLESLRAQISTLE